MNTRKIITLVSFQFLSGHLFYGQISKCGSTKKGHFLTTWRNKHIENKEQGPDSVLYGQCMNADISIHDHIYHK